jgi:hypothetical protein
MTVRESAADSSRSRPTTGCILTIGDDYVDIFSAILVRLRVDLSFLQCGEDYIAMFIYTTPLPWQFSLFHET